MTRNGINRLNHFVDLGVSGIGNRGTVNRQRFGRVNNAREHLGLRCSDDVGITQRVKLIVEVVCHERSRDGFVVGQAQCFKRDGRLHITIGVGRRIAGIVIGVVKVNRARRHQGCRGARHVAGGCNGL